MNMWLSTRGLEELSDKLLQLPDAAIKPAFRDALTAAGEVAVKYIRDSAPGTGGLKSAIVALGPFVSNKGGYTEIIVRRVPVRGWNYQDIGAELNYGSSRRSASHWFDNGVEQAEPEVESTLRARITNAIGL